MTRLAFDRFAAAERIAVRDTDNAASAGVVDRLGMRYRGIEIWYGEPCATHALSRGEWRALGTGITRPATEPAGPLS